MLYMNGCVSVGLSMGTSIGSACGQHRKSPKISACLSRPDEWYRNILKQSVQALVVKELKPIEHGFFSLSKFILHPSINLCINQSVSKVRPCPYKLENPGSHLREKIFDFHLDDYQPCDFHYNDLHLGDMHLLTLNFHDFNQKNIPSQRLSPRWLLSGQLLPQWQ